MKSVYSLNLTCLVLARRPKAACGLLASYDRDSAYFKAFASQGVYGVEFLLWAGREYQTLFLCTQAGRGLARELYRYLPLTQADIQRRELDGIEPYGPLPATIRGASVARCMGPIGLPCDVRDRVREFVTQDSSLVTV